MWRNGARDEAAADSAYDLTNFLISDDGNIVRRGWAVYKSNAAFLTANGLTAVWDGCMAPGRRTAFWSTEATPHLGTLIPATAPDPTTPTSLGTYGYTPAPTLP